MRHPRSATTKTRRALSAIVNARPQPTAHQPLTSQSAHASTAITAPPTFTVFRIRGCGFIGESYDTGFALLTAPRPHSGQGDPVGNPASA